MSHAIYAERAELRTPHREQSYGSGRYRGRDS
jgi:hypothetical protein